MGNLNTKIGFKSTMYSVTESSGYIEITIIKKVAEDMAFMVKTVDDTATAPDDYEALERIVTMSKNEKEHKIQIAIVDDDIWEPDKDFLVQICNEEGVRKEGSDTQCKVTILDEDNPGVIGFETRNIKVRKMDKYAYVRVVRQDGSDGDVKCMVSTRAEEDMPNAAREFEDFLPEERVLYFKHQEQEQTVQIQLNQTANIQENESAGNNSNENINGSKDKEDKSSGSSSDLGENDSKVFQVVLDRPMPEGVKISREKHICYIEIVSNDDQLMEATEI